MTEPRISIRCKICSYERVPGMGLRSPPFFGTKPDNVEPCSECWAWLEAANKRAERGTGTSEGPARALCMARVQLSQDERPCLHMRHGYCAPGAVGKHLSSSTGTTCEAARMLLEATKESPQVREPPKEIWLIHDSAFPKLQPLRARDTEPEKITDPELRKRFSYTRYVFAPKRKPKKRSGK